MASISKRNGRYHVRVRQSGYPSQCKSFSTRTDAKRWARDIERAMDKGTLQIEDCMLRELLDRYEREISSQKRGADVEHFRIGTLQRSTLGKLRLSQLRPMHVASFRDERLKEISAGSVQRELAILSNAISIAMTDWGYDLGTNPCDNVRRPAANDARERRLASDEFERLIRSCRQSENPYFAPLVEFASETAMRRGELLSLQWHDAYLDDSYCHLSQTKNGTARDVPLSCKAVQVLSSLRSSERGLVFPIHREALKGLWRRALGRAKIKDFHFHDLRHEATSRFFEKGLNVMEVASITGHKDLRMLQRYTHLRATDLAARIG